MSLEKEIIKYRNSIEDDEDEFNEIDKILVQGRQLDQDFRSQYNDSVFQIQALYQDFKFKIQTFETINQILNYDQIQEEQIIQ